MCVVNKRLLGTWNLRICPSFVWMQAPDDNEPVSQELFARLVKGPK